MIVKLYHPSNSNGKPLTVKTRLASLDSVARLFCQEFGGATVYNSVGYYLSNNGSIVQEDIKIVTSNIKKLTSAQKNKILKSAQTVKKELKQESVLIEFNNEPIFV